MSITEQNIETHPFDYFLPDNPRILVVGSFPGWEQVKNCEGEWFYTAKRNQFWSILSAVYEIDLLTVESKKRLCEKEGIAITDIFHQVIRRKPESNLDKFLEPVKYNDDRIKWILDNSKIRLILFTSHFVEKKFFERLPEIKNTQCLPSPSRAANIPISKSEEYKNYLIENPDGKTFSFKVFKYKKLLTN